ncbi:MAG: hypothetical protein JSU08_09055 [Acidobacteria bacterium]|nr:hypothetical protein [Acidobacteriota bacterium]
MNRTAVGPLSWTFPASVILGALTVWGWAMFAWLSRSAPPACELLDRSAWLAATSASTAGFLLPFTLVESRWLRGLSAVIGAAVAGALAWWLTALVFPRFC